MKRLKSLLIILSTLYIPLISVSGDTLHQFMWANIDNFSNNPQRALARYKTITTQSLWTYHGYIPFLFDHHKYETIVSLSSTIDTHFAHNPSLQLLLALAFKKMNNNTESDKRITALATHHPYDATIILRAAQVYVEQHNHTQAVSIIDTYLNQCAHRTNSFLFYFLKGQIYAQLKQYEPALENIEKCISLHPTYSQAWLIKAVIEEQKGNIVEAIAGYTHFLDITQDKKSHLHNHILALMARCTQGQLPTSCKVSYESYLDKAILYLTKNQLNQALIECNNYLRYNPTSIKGTLLKVHIYTAQHAFENAITLLCKKIDENPDNDIWYKTLYYLKEKNMRTISLETIFVQCATKYPESLAAHLYTADLLLRSTQPKRARPYLIKAEQLTPSCAQKVALLYQQALMVYDEKKYDEAKNLLARIIHLDTQYAPAYNLSAYIAAKEHNFSQAHAYIKKTLSLDPTNYHFKDTHGYILYKEEKYPEAEKIFASLMSVCNYDPTIITHLKKSYSKQNKMYNPPLVVQK